MRACSIVNAFLCFPGSRALGSILYSGYRLLELRYSRCSVRTALAQYLKRRPGFMIVYGR